MKNDLNFLHIDLDAFFASVEELDNPSLKGKPMVVGGRSQRGIITTANYEARKFGIHSAMSAQKAYELCPIANFVQGNRSHYAEISREIHQIFREYTDIIEPLSLDEAYLDVTVNKKNIKSAIKIARMIQLEIWQKLHLTCSAGVSYNKFLAKLASDYEKPKGLTVVLPENAESFLRDIPIEDFHGVGKKTVPKMHEMGIYKGKDLYEKSEMDLIREFGKMGYSLYRKVRGIHDSPVEPNRDRKSVGRENTFSKPLLVEDQVVIELRELAKDVEKSLKRAQLHGQTVVLKVRDKEYETFTKRVTIRDYIDDDETIYFYAKQIWDTFDLLERGIRLLGITVTNLESKQYELIKLPLWEKEQPTKKPEE